MIRFYLARSVDGREYMYCIIDRKTGNFVECTIEDSPKCPDWFLDKLFAYNQRDIARQSHHSSH